MRKLKIWWKLFKIRLHVAFTIILNKKSRQHWFIVYFDEKTLEKIILEEDNNLQLNLHYHMLHKYLVLSTCKKIVSTISDVDWICNKAEFEAEASLKTKK